jgi:lipopolysaccharide export LptBFGC system permease protein LptF
MERLIDPVIADLQAEHAMALGTWTRQWRLLLGYTAFAKVMLLCGVFGIREAWRHWDQDDSNVLLRTAWVSGIAIVLISVALWLPQLSRSRQMLRIYGSFTNATLSQLMLYLLPSVLPVSVPVGLAIGAALGPQGRARSRRLLAAIAAAALIASAASLVTLGWITPAANQSYREAIVGQPIPKGDREMGLMELRRAVDSVEPDRARRFLFTFHRTLGIATAPITFVAFALVIAIRRRAGRAVAVSAIVAATFGYYIAMWLGGVFNNGGLLSPELGAWMPQMALVLTTILIGLPRTFTRTPV